jgi:hypothetical protein
LLPVSDMATVVSISLLVRGRLILLVNPTVSAKVWPRLANARNQSSN